MDDRRYHNLLDGILASFAGKQLLPAVVRLLRAKLKVWLREALTDASYERMFYLKAGDLRSMGGVIPPEIGDERLIACRQTKDADGEGHVGLIIETTQALPGKQFFLDAGSDDQESNETQSGPPDENPESAAGDANPPQT